MDKLRFMVLMVDDHTRMSMPVPNYEYYFTPVTELEYYEHEKGPGNDEPNGKLSDDKYVSNTEDRITYRDNNQIGRENIGCVGEV